MKTDISDLRSQLIEEARGRIARAPDEDEVTSAMLAEELGCTAKMAAVALNRMVEDGLATVRKNGPQGRNVYKKKG